MIRNFGPNRYAESDKAKAISKLDVALSKLVRSRDGSYITCGRGYVPLDAGHFRGRECMATCFHHRNITGRCKKENRFEGRQRYEFGFAIDKKFGAGTVQELF